MTTRSASRERCSLRAAARAAALAMILVLLSGCGDDGGDQGASVPAGERTAVQILSLAGDTSTADPIDGLLAVAFTADGTRLVTSQVTPDRAVSVRVFPYEPGRRMTPADGWEIVRVDHPYVHSGGGLAFDANGDLLVSIGAYVVPNEDPGPQNPDGVVVRVPAPFLEAAPAALFDPGSELVVRGLRNPWRMSIDRDTGDLWIGDVGEDRQEEIDRIPASDLTGPPPNLGWPYVEGTAPLLGEAPSGLDLIPPVWSYDRVGRPANIIGGYVYRGDEIGDLAGRYVFADYVDRTVRALAALGDDDMDAADVAEVPENPTAFAEDPDGELYVLGSGGTVFRLRGDGASSVRLDRVASVWAGQPPQAGSEATALAFEPGGGGLIVSDRTGRIFRIALGDRPRGLCEDRFDLFPQMVGSTDDDLERKVRAAAEFLERHADEFPADLEDEIELTSEAYARLLDAGAQHGWDDKGLRRSLLELSLERGEYSHVFRAQYAISNAVADICR